MTGRRELLFGVAGSLSVAGCLGSVSGVERGLAQAEADTDSDDDAPSDTEPSDSDSDTDSPSDDPPKGLPGFTVEDIELRYASHVGITTLLWLKNEENTDQQTVRIVTEARESDGLLGDDSTWTDIPPVSPRPVELTVDNIFDLYGNLGGISEFVIKGRVPEGEYGEIESFSGGAFRDEVGVEGGETEDDDTDVEVDVESDDDTDDDEQSDEDTEEPTDDDGEDDAGGDEDDAGDEDDDGGSLADELDVDF